MAIDKITSMFKTPEEIMLEERQRMQAIAAERQRSYASRGQGLGAFQSVVQAFSGLTDLPLIAAEQELIKNNPLYNKAMDREYILSSYAEQDLTKPETMRSLIKNLQARGHTKEALALAGELQAIERGNNEAVTAFTGMIDGKRVPLTYDKNTGSYKYNKDGKLVPYTGDIEYKPGSIDPTKEEIAARLRSQRLAAEAAKKNGTAPPAAGNVQMGKDGRPTGKLNPANLPPPAAGGVTPQQALQQAEALRLKQQALMQAERQRILQGMEPGPVDQGQLIAP